MNHLCKLRGVSHVRELIASYTGAAMGTEFVNIRNAVSALGGEREDEANVRRQYTIAAGHCVTRG